MKDKKIATGTAEGSSLKEAPVRKGGRVQLLLVSLCLLAGIGAGLYLLGQNISTPAVPVTEHKPVKMKVPERPSPMAQEEGVKEEIVTQEEVAVISTKSEPTPVSNPVPVTTMVLTAGSYISPRTVKQVSAQIEKLGYKVSSSQKKEPYAVTRLLVGRFEKDTATKRLAEVKKHAEGAFLMAENGKYSVYAGSFVSLDRARREADILFQKGIRVDERQSTIDFSVTTLRFGEFASEAEAQGTLDKLKKKGVEKLKIVSL